MLTSLRKDGQKRFETQHRAPRPVLTIRRRPGWRQGFCSAPRTRAASPQRPRAVPPPSTSAPFEILKSVTGHSVRRHLYHAEWVTQAAGTQVSSPESGPLQSRDMGTDMLLMADTLMPERTRGSTSRSGELRLCACNISLRAVDSEWWFAWAREIIEAQMRKRTSEQWPRLLRFTVKVS